MSKSIGDKPARVVKETVSYVHGGIQQEDTIEHTVTFREELILKLSGNSSMIPFKEGDLLHGKRLTFDDILIKFKRNVFFFADAIIARIDEEVKGK